MKTIIGIMWPGPEATPNDIENAYQVGRFSALKGFATLTWWRNLGVMDAGLKWAREANGLTIGLLPDDNEEKMSKYIDIRIVTNMKAGRNYMNALSSDIMVVCGMWPGTSTETSFAIQADKPVILVGTWKEAEMFYQKLSPSLSIAANWEEAIEIIQQRFIK